MPVVVGQVISDPDQLSKPEDNTERVHFLKSLNINTEDEDHFAVEFVKLLERFQDSNSGQLYHNLEISTEAVDEKLSFTIETDLPHLIIRLLKTVALILNNTSNHMDLFEETQVALKKLLQQYWAEPVNLKLKEIAKAIKIPSRSLNEGSDVLELGYGKNRKLLNRTLPNSVGVLSDKLTSNKYKTHRMLKSAGLPASDSLMIDVIKTLPRVIEHLGFPLALKPRDGMRGNGVVLNIQNESELKEAFHIASQYDRRLVVEKYCLGEDHRLMVLGGKCRYAVSRKKPAVTGDGQHSVEQRMEIENKSNPLRLNQTYSLLKINKTQAKTEYLRKIGLDYSYIPKQGELVILHPIPNLLEGGDCEDVMQKIHPANLQLAEEACAILGLEMGGVDFVSPDCSKPYWENNAIIVEINSMPSLRPVSAPNPDRFNEIAEEFLSHVMASPSAKKVITTVYVGNQAADTLKNQTINLQKSTKTLTSTTDGNFIDRLPLNTPANSRDRIEQALFHPSADCILIEDSLSDIAREGLGYRFIDNIVVTEIPSETSEKAALHLLLKNTTSSVSIPPGHASFVKYLTQEFPKLNIEEIIQ